MLSARIDVIVIGDAAVPAALIDASCQTEGSGEYHPMWAYVTAVVGQMHSIRDPATFSMTIAGAPPMPVQGLGRPKMLTPG